MGSVKYKLVQGTFFLMISQAAVVLSGYLIHIGLARWFGPAVYGDFGFILSLILIAKTVFLFGPMQAVAKYVAQFKERSQEIYRTGKWIISILIVFCLLIFFFFSKFIASSFKDPGLTNIILFSSLVILTLGFYAIKTKGLLNGLHLFNHQALAEIIHSVLKVILAFFLVFLGFDLFGAVAAYIISPLLALIFISWLVRKKIPKDNQNNKININFSKLILIKYALPLMFFNILITISMEWGLLAVKGYLVDDVSTGFYTAAVSLARITYSLFMAFSLTMLPTISSAMAAGNLPLVRKYIRKSMRYAFLLLFPLAVLISSYAKEIIVLIYSPVFVEAAIPLSILVFAFTFFSLFVTESSFLLGAGQPKIATFFALICVLLMGLFSALMVPVYGLTGAAFASMITAVTCFLLLSLYLFLEFKALVKPSSIMKIITATAITYFAARHWSFPGKFFLVSLGLQLILYFLILILLKEINSEDWRLVKSLFKLGKFSETN